MPAAHHQPIALSDRPERRAAPGAAERARTVLQSASSVVLDIPGVDLVQRPGIPPLAACTGLPDGALAALVEGGSPLFRVVSLSRAEEVPAELDAVDVAPVAMPHRIRARVRARGRLVALPYAGARRISELFPRCDPEGRALLRLELDHLAIEDLWGAECCIDLDTFAAAAPDPVAGEEVLMLQHLAAEHLAQLHALAGRALDHPAGLRSWGGPADSLRTVRPVALDRFGLRLRLLGATPEELLDARFDFHRPVRSADELPEAMHRLFAG